MGPRAPLDPVVGLGAIEAAEAAYGAVEAAIEAHKTKKLLAKGEGCVVLSPLLGKRSEWRAVSCRVV